MSGPAAEARRRLDLVHLLNSQASAWRAPLMAPGVRTSDGLAADSPMGWQGVPWWRHVGVRSLAFLVALTAVWAGINGLWFMAGLHVGVTWYLPVVFELIPAVAAYLLVVMVLERRRPAIEYAPRRWGGLIHGLVLGAIICLVVTGIIWLLGGITFVGVEENPPWLSRLISLGLVAGVAEEIVLRGVLFRYVESLLGTWASVAISAVVFGGLHLSNENATLTGAVAIALEAGLVFAVLYALTRSLWVVVGVHAGWNLMQGLGLGIVVSGSTDEGQGFLISHPTGSDLVSGSRFGIEASVVAVGVWLVVAAYLSWRLVRSGGVVQPAWIRHKRFPGNPTSDTPRTIFP
ncbi:MAG: CPBP family intramembrane glutamic endopeptidase [Propionibacteriaceae bacterium]